MVLSTFTLWVKRGKEYFCWPNLIQISWAPLLLIDMAVRIIPEVLEIESFGWFAAAPGTLSEVRAYRIPPLVSPRVPKHQRRLPPGLSCSVVIFLDFKLLKAIRLAGAGVGASAPHTTAPCAEKKSKTPQGQN